MVLFVQKFWSFSILILLNSSMLLPFCPCLCPTSTSLSQSLPKLLYLCIISPPLSSISIKDVLLIDAKACIWGRSLRLESCIFYGHHLDSSLDTMCRILWPWYQLVEHLPLSHCMGHPFAKLELLEVRELSSLDDHLKFIITCGTNIWCARCHLYEYYL